MWELVIQNGKFQGRRLQIPLGKSLLIGRDPSCQLVVPSSLISRKHCELKQAVEGIWVRDLGSRNGTYVNDVAVTDLILLDDMDQLRIGVLVFVVTKPLPPDSAPPPVASEDVQKPVTHAVSRAAERRRAAQISDDDIAVWLTDEDLPEATSQETSIIGRSPQESTTLSPVPTATRGAALPPFSEPVADKTNGPHRN